MATLYELSAEFQQLYEIAQDDDDPKALIDTLQGMMAEVETKAEGYALVMKQLDMEIKQADEEMRFWKAKKEARENNVKRMKNALLQAMEMMKVTEIPAGKFTFKLHKNGGKAPVEITGDVPDNMTKVTVEPDKEKIREYLEKLPDKKCEWAVMMERGYHVVIK